MPPIAYFGIESSGLNLVIDLLILFVLVLWFSLVYWTYADAKRRIVDPMLVGCATAASLFPFVGTIVYVILRPPEYLEDMRERELEMRAAEARLHDLDHSLCPHCDYRIERDFVRCPSCLRKLKERCVSCQRPLDQAWTICPYCETEVPGAIAPSRRRRRARRTATASEDEAAASFAEDPSFMADSALALDPDSSELGLSTMTSTNGVEGGDTHAEPVAAPEPMGAPEPASPRSRAAGRARRPRT
jgi:Double zinc ribbon